MLSQVDEAFVNDRRAGAVAIARATLAIECKPQAFKAPDPRISAVARVS